LFLPFSKAPTFLTETHNYLLNTRQSNDNEQQRHKELNARIESLFSLIKSTPFSAITLSSVGRKIRFSKWDYLNLSSKLQLAYA